MSKTKHTPGPWAAWWNEAGGRFYIHAADGREVARVPNGRIEATQNADLIAQAPALLAACEAAAEELDWENAQAGLRREGHEALTQLRNALALARGEGGEPR